MGSEYEQLRPKQRLAIAKLLTEPAKLEDVARAAGVSMRTLRRWMHEDARFQQAMRAAEAEILTEVTRTLTGVARQAVHTLESVMSLPSATVSERLRAADIVLRWTLPYRDFVSVVGRLERIESLLAKGGTGP